MTVCVRSQANAPRAFAACVAAFAASASVAVSAAAASPFASSVILYEPGVNFGPGFTDPNTALGAPERFTGEGTSFSGAVTPFNPPFGTDEVVSSGEGGSLTVRFDQPVTDDPLNPFGIDLLIFGNTFLGLSDFADPINGVATASFPEGGIVEVSADGVQFETVVGVDADGSFSTLGYSDLIDPFSPVPGSVETDFLKPVDPSFDPIGKTLAEIAAGYDGSGGGAGIDLASVGLASIQYVRITNPMGSGFSPEIDAFADVRAIPAPAPAALLMVGLLAHTRRRERAARITARITDRVPLVDRARRVPHG